MNVAARLRRTLRRGLAALAGALLLASTTPAALAQDIEPRAYSNAPVGVNFLIAGYAFTQGGVAFDSSLPLKNPDLDIHSAVFAYARAIDFFGKSGKVDVILPYSRLSGSADFGATKIEREVDGAADARFRLSVNFHGAPALSPQEFAAYRQDLIVGASVQVTAPTGQYDDRRIVNLGSNRWSIKPELGVSQALGPWTLEAAAALVFFSDNDDFYGGRKRSQEALHSLQGHAIYNFRAGPWASFDVTYFAGGQTRIDGRQNDDRQENWRVGATLAFPLDRRNSIKLYASSGVASRTGNDFDLLGVAWQYRWGGGL